MKNRISFLLGLSLLLIASSAHAQALQTWVSATGNDFSFDCSRLDPCQTFAGAIARTAVGGQISVVDAGDFGTVVITKSITITGNPASTSILAQFSNGVIINVVGPSDPGIVILRGLSVNGAGTGLNGIRYLRGAKLIVDNCNVYGFTQSNIDVSLTTPGNLVIKDSTLTGGAAGISLASTSGDDTLVQVTHSLIAGNTAFGLHADGKGTISVANSLLTNNGVAVQADTLGTVRLSNTEIFDNETGIGCGSGTVASSGDNKQAGNPGDVRACRPRGTVAVF